MWRLWYGLGTGWIALCRYVHCVRKSAAVVLFSDNFCGMQHTVLKQHIGQLRVQLHNIGAVHPVSKAAAQAPDQPYDNTAAGIEL